jgi:hypothetical protein
LTKLLLPEAVDEVAEEGVEVFALAAEVAIAAEGLLVADTIMK